MQTQEFTINLVSNASMATYPNNTLSQFTTLLPNQLTLTGFWEVALAEISWPSTIQNITQGQFKFKLEPQEGSDYRAVPKRSSNLVSMYTPIPTIAMPITEKHERIKPGMSTSVDQILQSICKRVLKNDDGKWPITWKVDEPSQILKVYTEVSNPICSFLEVTSSDLVNVLGLQTIIDRQNTTSKNKTIGQFPIDLSGGCNTIFLYCDLVQNEIVGDTQAALLRAIPLNEPKKHGVYARQQNYQTFSNLQWRRVGKTSIESITISLRNESGQLIPFLSRGRTNLTLHFRKRSEH